MTVAEAARVAGAKVISRHAISTGATSKDAVAPDAVAPSGGFHGCSIDSRQVSNGALFAALSGEQADGHDFVHDAIERGAGAVLSERVVEADVPLLVVKSCRRALGRLAKAWRQRFSLPIVGVTGSNGKTTVKNMIAQVLRSGGPALTTVGNLNNELGLPLTLMALDEPHRRAVVELGANHMGEIDYLADMVKPQVGVITQCAPAHLEGFGSIEAVAKAKGELLLHLTGANSCAVLNADDVYFSYWRSNCAAVRTLSFGFSKTAQITCEWQVSDGAMEVEIRLPQESVTTRLNLLGRHNVMNAMAAAAAAHALECETDDIVRGLARTAPAPGRLQHHRLKTGVSLIDDTYNANPVSTNAAIDVLAQFAGPCWMVLGDMAELGDAAADWHRGVGAYAKDQAIHQFFSVGCISRASSDAFGQYGQHFTNCEGLIEKLRAQYTDAGAILVKGSRSMCMERVVNALLEADS